MFFRVALIFCLIYLSSSSLQIKQNIEKAMAQLTSDKLPLTLKDYLASKDDNTHWCCKIDLEPTVETRTRVVSYNIVASGKHRCGYHSCGFLGWGSCTSWCYNYWTETRYHTEDYVITKQTPCPDDSITCCNGYMLVAGHCLTLDEINENQQLLELLNNEGVLQGGIGK